MTSTERKVRRIGVFGGSFNPPHRGHEELVESLLARGLVDEVWVVPVFDHPFGKELAPFADRLEMCRLAFGRLDGVRVLPIERDLGGPSYTVRTLERLKRDLGEDDQLFLVVGADALKESDHWRNFERVRELARLLVVPRQGETGADTVPIPPPIAASSSDVRRRVAGGQATAGLLSPEVESYVARHALYRRAEATNRQRGDQR